MDSSEKLEYVGCDLKKVAKGRWLLLAKFKGADSYFDWAPKWESELDRLYAAAYLVELLNGGYTLEGFQEIYTMLNQGMTEALEKAKITAKGIDIKEIERVRQNWRQIIEQAPVDVRRTPASAIFRATGTQPLSLKGDTLILAFRYPYLKEKMEEPENKRIAEKIVSDFLGRPCRVQCVLDPEIETIMQAALKLGATIVDDKGGT